MHIVGFLLFGLLIGAVGCMLATGRSLLAWGISMLCGVCGAGIGGFLGRIGRLSGDHDPAGFASALLGAFALVAAYLALGFARRRVHTPRSRA